MYGLRVAGNKIELGAGGLVAYCMTFRALFLALSYGDVSGARYWRGFSSLP